MPRSRIDLRHTIEHLAILDSDGACDAALDPRLSTDDLKTLFRAMLLARRWDERMIKLSRQGRIGTYPPTCGQEAASIGPAFVMTADDWLVPSFREMPAMLHLGWPMEKLILGWWGGNEHGAQPPEGLKILPLAGPVATQCQYAAGIAMGLKFNRDPGVVLCFLGDGGTSEGDFHEAMNVAGVFRLPLITIVQNNGWAISLPRARQTASQTLAQKAIAYGFDGIQVDGNDILAMVVATREAVARAREGRGPTLIEAMTYRLGEHSTSDNSAKYRTPEEVKQWAARDPLLRFTRYLDGRGLLTEADRKSLDDEVSTQISAAIEKAERFVPDPAEPFDHVFATPTPELVAQRAVFESNRGVESARVADRLPTRPRPHAHPVAPGAAAG